MRKLMDQGASLRGSQPVREKPAWTPPSWHQSAQSLDLSSPAAPQLSNQETPNLRQHATFHHFQQEHNSGSGGLPGPGNLGQPGVAHQNPLCQGHHGLNLQILPVASVVVSAHFGNLPPSWAPDGRHSWGDCGYHHNHHTLDDHSGHWNHCWLGESSAEAAKGSSAEAAKGSQGPQRRPGACPQQGDTQPGQLQLQQWELQLQEHHGWEHGEGVGQGSQWALAMDPAG